MTFGDLVRRLRLVLRRDRRLDDLDEEMRLHLELRAAANRGAGVGDADAAARRRFGNVLKLKEESRDAWGFTGFERFGRDVRYGWRQLFRRPAWTAAVVLTLAVGIGANTAMFTLIEALLFGPGRGANPGELVWIAGQTPRASRIQFVSYPDYVAYRDRMTTLSGVMAYTGADFSIGRPNTERLFGSLVSGNYFDVLSIRMAIGRGFAPDEDRVPGARPVVVLSHSLWQRRYGSDPNVVGQAVTLNARSFTIIGVAPAGFDGAELGEDDQLWIPLAMTADMVPSRADLLTRANAGWLRVQGRLRPGTSVGDARAEAKGIAAQLNEPGMPPAGARTAVVVEVRGGLDPSNRGEFAPVLALLSLVPMLVLLVACANVANVLFARNVGRRRELALRRAVGATRGHLIRQLLMESLSLSLAAGIVGIVVSYLLTAAIAHFGEVPAEVVGVLSPDVRVLVATTMLAVATSIVCGLAPAVTGTRFDLLPVLKDEGASTPGLARRRVRSAFVVAQLALSLVLLVTAGLFLGSLSKALGVNPGFDIAETATVSVDLDLQGYTGARHATFVAQALDRAAALPGVESAAIASPVPLAGTVRGSVLAREGTKDESWSAVFSVSPRYFETMGIPIVRGRGVLPADGEGAEPIVVVSQTLARALWQKTDPIGQRLRTDDRNAPWRVVVGVAADVKYGSLTDNDSPAAYFDERQAPASPIAIVVRTSGDPRTVLAPLATALHALDADLPVFRVGAIADAIRQNVDKQRAASAFLAVFGVLALFLAAVGIYGVTATNASFRTREIGIRMSLGARAGDIVRAFVGEALLLGGIGVVVGALVSLALSSLLESFLFGLAPTDAMTFGGAAVVLTASALVASYVPARRAARVDPLVALRHE